jgi:hypothetical protein
VKIYYLMRMLKRWMWEKKAGVFQQPLDAACFNPADNAKTVLEWQLENDVIIVGDRLFLLFPIVRLTWVEDETVNGDACHMAATRSAKNCTAHA